MKGYSIRWCAAGLAACLLAAGLVGCGKDGTGNEDPVAAEEGVMGSYQQELECSMGRRTLANPKFPEGDSYEDNAYTRYVAEKLNIRIRDEFEANGEDYDRQVSLAIASGELPDALFIGSKDILDELVENDLIEDLTDVYADYASDYIKGIYDSYDGRCLDTATYDGRLMAIPGTNLDSAPCVAYVRQDWLDKTGLSVDVDGDHCLTIDELELIGKTFLEQDPGESGNPVGMAFVPYLTADDYGGSGYTINAVTSAFHAFPKLWIKDESGKVIYGSAAPEMKETLGQLAAWFEEGILDPQFGTRTWDDITALLTNNQLGIAFGPWHIPDWLLNNVKGMNPEAEFSAFTICDEEGKVNVAHSNAGSGYMVVRKGYSNPEVIVKMLNLFFDDIVNHTALETEAPEVAAYISQGVDNSARPFQVEVNAYTSLLDDYADIKGCLNGEITVEEVHTAESKSIVEAIKRLQAGGETEVNDWAKYTSRMGGIELIESLTKKEQFNWETPVFRGTTETMKKSSASLGKMEEEVFVGIVTGSVPLDDFDTFVEDWKAQGGEAITAEIEEVLGGE